MPRTIAPAQSIFGVSLAVLSSANIDTSTIATTATPTITQNTERKPNVPASQPPRMASTPPIPPFTEVRIDISRAYLASSVTLACSMMSVIGTTGPHTPCITRPTISMGTFTANAETTQPMAVMLSMPSNTFLRPARSPSRGRNSENSAHAVKKTVWVRLICELLVFSPRSIVVSAGESMEALS